MLTVRDWQGWVAMYEADPFGNFRSDYNASMIASWIARAHFKHPPKQSELMFESESDKIARLDVDQSDDEMRAAMSGFRRAE